MVSTFELGKKENVANPYTDFTQTTTAKCRLDKPIIRNRKPNLPKKIETSVISPSTI